jgi:hypothetical protein
MTHKKLWHIIYWDILTTNLWHYFEIEIESEDQGLSNFFNFLTEDLVIFIENLVIIFNLIICFIA